VLESEVAVAIKSVQSPNEHLTIDEIRKLRNEATVKCSKCHNPCNLKQQQCVFYVVDDPCEQNNIIDSMDPAILSYLRSRYDYWSRIALPPRNKLADPHCDPANFNYTWSPWK